MATINPLSWITFRPRFWIWKFSFEIFLLYFKILGKFWKPMNFNNTSTFINVVFGIVKLTLSTGDNRGQLFKVFVEEILLFGRELFRSAYCWYAKISSIVDLEICQPFDYFCLDYVEFYPEIFQHDYYLIYYCISHLWRLFWGGNIQLLYNW